MMPNRKGLSKDVLKEKLQKGEMTCETRLFDVYKMDTRDVLVLSTYCSFRGHETSFC